MGLEVDGFVLINPTEGAASDTVAYVKRLGVGINIREYLKNKNIEVKKLILDDVDANLYTSEEGNSNFDVFAKSEDKDTSSEPFELPELLSLNSIRVNHLNASYIDLKSNTDARIGDLNLSLDASYSPNNIDANLNVDINNLVYKQSDDST